jgi:protoporphyrinogen IX oxidase
MNDSRKAVIPCFSSLSRCLSVLTAIRLAGPGPVPGPFFLPPIIRAMGSGYLWVKAFHIVFVASWFAGLFYLPRLFVNLAMVPVESHAERVRLLLMARKLYRFAGLLMLPALALGLVLWLAYGVGLGSGNGWMHAKLALVLAVLAYHHVCGRMLRRFEQGGNRRSERWYRVFNEASVLLFAAIVVLVVVKPF